MATANLENPGLLHPCAGCGEPLLPNATICPTCKDKPKAERPLAKAERPLAKAEDTPKPKPKADDAPPAAKISEPKAEPKKSSTTTKAATWPADKGK